VKIPAAPNQAVLQSGGALAARLSEQEILLVDKLTGSDLLLPQLEQHYDINACPQTYVLPRADSHSCFAVTGRFAERMFAKVCGVDLRANSFATGQVAQTSLARVNGIIIRQDSGTVPFFWVLSDISSSEFLWTCLLDAMTEFSGAPIGIPALQALTQD
jgi:sarcosine oxidase subunit gamma